MSVVCRQFSLQLLMYFLHCFLELCVDEDVYMDLASDVVRWHSIVFHVKTIHSWLLAHLQVKNRRSICIIFSSYFTSPKGIYSIWVHIMANGMVNEKNEKELSRRNMKKVRIEKWVWMSANANNLMNETHSWLYWWHIDNWHDTRVYVSYMESLNVLARPVLIFVVSLKSLKEWREGRKKKSEFHIEMKARRKCSLTIKSKYCEKFPYFPWITVKHCKIIVQVTRWKSLV